MNYFEIKAALRGIAESGELCEFDLKDTTTGKVLKGWTNEDNDLCLVDPTSKKKDSAYPIDKVIAKQFTSEALLKAVFSASYDITTMNTVTKVVASA